MKKILIILLMVGNFLVAQTIMIEVAYEGEDYKIVKAWLVEKTFPATKKVIVKSEDDIVIELKDKNSTVVDEIRIENPRIVRGVFSEEENEEGHENFKDTSGSFIVRYPYEKGLQYLNIVNAKEREIKKEETFTTNNPPAPEKMKVSKSFKDMDFGSLLKVDKK